jgi:hypothetical protein
MKNRNLVISVIFVALVFLLQLQICCSVASTYSGAWEPDGCVVLTFDSSLTRINGLSFYIYDFDNQSHDLKLFSDGVFSTKVLFFSHDSNGYYIGFQPRARTFALGDSADFGFYFKYSGVSYDSYGLQELESSFYKLTWSYGAGTCKDWDVYVAGASPVPIPASAVLLGSGLLVLAGLGFRKRKVLIPTPVRFSTKHG